MPDQIGGTDQAPELDVSLLVATGALPQASGQILGQPGIYVPPGWGSFWRAARANAHAGTGLARVAFVGDSLFEGLLSSNLDTKPYTGLIKAALQTAYGDGGSGFKSVADTPLILDLSSSTYGNAVAGVVTLTGTWVNNTTADGPAAQNVQAQSNGATATYVIRGRFVSVLYFTGASASFGQMNVSIDGTAQTPVNTNTGAQGVAETIYDMGSGSTGNHTVVVTAPNATASTAFVFLCGFSGRNSSGVVADKYARGGFGSDSMANLASHSFTAQSTTYGAVSGSFGKAGQWSGGSARPADLVIYGMGLNDSHATTTTLNTPDTYIRNVRLFLDDVKTGGTQQGNVDLMLIANFMGPGFEDSATTYYANFVSRLRALADAYGAAFVNLWELGRNSWNWMITQGYMGTQANAGGGAGTDPVHFSDLGHQWAANQILPALQA
jgi:lysophospholipase L1-like esterase